MGYCFCWQHKECSEKCPVHELKILFCWKYFQEESRAGVKDCPNCGYFKAFAADEFFSLPSIKEPSDDSKTILVVDDEPNILYALEEMVNLKGYQCVSAADGRDGLIIARNINPDLIITDIIMPNLNGYELCHILKRDKKTSHIPIIMVTVKSTEKEKLEGNLAGADAYITKPFSPAELQEIMEYFLSV